MSTNNFFAALDDSEDEAPLPKKVQPKKESSKPKESSTVSKKKNAGPKGDRRRPNNNDRNTKSGRGRPTVRDGKRAYDRRSGTGRGKEMKKGGGGAHNWGSDKNDARKAEGHIDENEKPEEKTEEPSNEEVEKKEPIVVEEEEDKTISLEDYLKNKKAVSDSGIFGPKKEKAMDSDFSGAVAHEIVEETFLVMGSGKTLRKKGGEKKKSTQVDLGFRVAKGNDDRRRDNGDRRGGRGDRRGGRGGRGKRGESGKAFELSSKAFPSL